MDPDAALTQIRDVIAALSEPEEDSEVAWAQVDDLVDAVRALDGWLSKGGFLPREWQAGGKS